ncbi:(deoxy)nucleoside triphosphate pyrophosphohydrolase [Flavobacterium sp. ACAM 123]|jgi:8-oxo-dGTP diphosphatase|uniref:(deoxy)nucleoside triphosphate pyrophosphohydrolase n=1 Tax=Flavobacterium sp. ACAM 123 TaxID=1189620 RepID=UPI0002E8047F|nr:NUDIX domain-containing protein [Flavobacterium sp. ACAM 123]
MINVTCGIIIIADKILVAQRSEKMKLPLKWEFPGGKVEDNEKNEECIVREIREEIDIEIKIVKKLTNSIYDYGTFKINLIPFIANYISGNIKHLEHKDYRLLDKSELMNLDWAGADLPIVEELIKIEL